MTSESKGHFGPGPAVPILLRAYFPACSAVQWDTNY